MESWHMNRLAAFLLLPLLAPGQEPADTGLVFKATTSMVMVDVFVRDRAGKAVDNLKKEDFRILENGKPQEIAVCDFQRLTRDSAKPETPPPAPQSELPAARANAVRVESPGKVQYRDKRLLVMFFDFSSMQPQ